MAVLVVVVASLGPHDKCTTVRSPGTFRTRNDVISACAFCASYFFPHNVCAGYEYRLHWDRDYWCKQKSNRKVFASLDS